MAAQSQVRAGRRTLGRVLSASSETLVLTVPAYRDQTFTVARMALPERLAARSDLEGKWLYLRMQLDEPDIEKVVLSDFVAMDQPRSVSWPGLGS